MPLHAKHLISPQRVILVLKIYSPFRARNILDYNGFKYKIKKKLSSFYVCSGFSLWSMCQGILRYHQTEFTGQWCGCVVWGEFLPTERWKRGYLLWDSLFWFYHLCSPSLPHGSQSAPFHLIVTNLEKSQMVLYLHLFEDCRILDLQCLVRMEHTEQGTCQQSLCDTKWCPGMDHSTGK